MKKILIAILTVALFCGISFAGELRTLPQYLVLSGPTTNQVKAVTLTHYYDPDSPYAVMTIFVLDNNGVRDKVSVVVRDEVDNIESITANCIAEDNPWDLCTGAGACDNDCDESTTTYSDAIAGYGATMKSRFDALAWQRLQELYETQATP